MAAPAFAITIDGAFSALGAGGRVNGQTIMIGGGGSVEELDAFVAIEGRDLDGFGAGRSARLSDGVVPADLDITFSSALSSDGTNLVLSYAFENTGSAVIRDLRFLSFVDAEIDEATNSFFNEVASTSGSLATGQSFEADEPGFAFGDLYDNLLDGALDGTNAFPPADDVSLALSFDVDELGVGDVATFRIMLSEDGDRLGDFALVHSDTGAGSDTRITYSGDVRIVRDRPPTDPIPEPGAALLFAAGLGVIALARRR